jgi:hypothetical protein
MSKLIEKDQWVWVVIQDPGGVEQFLGQQDAKNDETFIPVFLEKEEAQQGLSLFLLNGAGEVLEKIET